MEKLTTKDFWDSQWQGNEQTRRFDRRLAWAMAFDILFQKHLPQRQLRALEVGAGASIWPAHLEQRYGHKVVGLDYSWPGCRLAGRNYRAQTGAQLDIVNS